MNKSKYEVTVTHHDYDLNEEVVDAEVSIHGFARAVSQEQFAQLLDDYANCFRDEYSHGKKIGEFLTHHHRTLQRSIIVELVGIIAGLSEQTYTDARNEYAVKLAKSIKALYEDIGAGMMV